ncbi:NAD-dependent epimerase/dehydratase family protein [Rhodanobacter sp. L36]|uniref:NAD-dependent epimerase/dehydratase family protein n=1 Tax=Rhodanobacter sp. L36 TaxID=1747221 RepID=UPI00131AB8F2|nr:NAD-dependent epimerase/dehydratase family protein [Rhodanobacter sp. L36]
MSEQVLLAGCGDLGMRVAERLIARGDEVWAMRRTLPAATPAGIRWIRGDLTEPQSLCDLPHDITQVVYAPAPDRRDENAYRVLFVDGLQRLLRALDVSKLSHVLFVSSSAVYGEHGDAWVDEETPTSPPGFNGRVLREAEQWLDAQAVPSIILRLAGLYGPGRLQLLDRLRERAVTAPRERKHWANRIHIDDAAAAVVHLLGLAHPLPLYLGVDNTPLPLDVLYDHLAELIGAPSLADGPAPVGVGSKRLSNARLRDSGFVPRWPDSRDGYAALFRQEDVARSG